jgi:CRISPR-associated endonuclease/helicase Cas3
VAVAQKSLDFLGRLECLTTVDDVEQNLEPRIKQPITNFWGKASPTSQSGPSSHSIAYHSLDVTAVGAELIARDRARLKRIATAVGIDIETLRWTLPFFLALHDIGKYARVFQAKSPEHWSVSSLGLYREIAPGNSHVVTGFQLLVAFSDEGSCRDVFETVMPGWSASERKILFRALAGHHGRPPPEEGIRSSLGSHDVCDACFTAAQAHIHAMFGLLRPPVLPRRPASALNVLAVGLAGLFVLADWIGSAETWFPYAAPIDGDETLECYWRRAQVAARRAVDEAGVSPALVKHFEGMSQLFGHVLVPSPVQVFAETVPLPDGPSLTIIEDVTGSGKTEAALTLAHRLMATARATGLYVALPTEATANAMYARLGASFRRLFTAEASPSLVLAHGHRALHEGFQDSVVDTASRALARNGSRDSGGDERPSSAECAEWIADDRRKAFLADVGAGTIDQALLAILPVKHQSLRLWGLADRVLIVDEAHAYDAYMTREIETLLEFQAALGGSTIVLSATLPQVTRRRFANAFRAGVSVGRIATAGDLQATDYPLVTIIGRDSKIEAAQPIRDGLARFVTATRVDDLEGALARVIAAAQAGACVAFVRNSVDEAIAACDRLRAAGLDPLLFHARFAMSDRQRIEAEVMGIFGPPPTDAATRRGHVLVATQVIEQSLDLDFDLVVTDLAPIDLMIQRAGRLCRHARGVRPIAGPELVVLSSDPIADPDKDWANRVLGRGARVYPNHALLWRSARALFRAGGIATPEGVRALVEAVYGDDVEPAPKKIEETEIRHDGKMKADTTVADMNVLYLRQDMSHPTPGYQEGRGKWDPDIHTPTRLTEDSLRIRLGRLVDGTVRPWADADESWRAWALSEVSVRRGRIETEDHNDPVTAAPVASAKAQWPEAERTVPLIALRRQGETWVGFGQDRDGQTVEMLYSIKSGLSFF